MVFTVDFLLNERRTKMRKKIILCVGVLLMLAAFVLGGMKLLRVKEARQSGICLAFDDYYPDNWESYFDLFDEYGVNVTFFVTLYEPTDFCYKAIDRGHEIGFHTAGHVPVPEMSEEQLKEQILDPMERFKEQGIELTSFAYPGGARNEDTDKFLLEHFNLVRCAYKYQVNGKDVLRHGVVESMPIDFHYYSLKEESEEAFKNRIDSMMEELSNNVGAVASIYSHGIDDGAEWCVSEKRLRYIFEKADEYGLKFYTFKELQKD